jgi:ubiquinone/menaquinone biosynthesis C-methylase UbiE
MKADQIVADRAQVPLEFDEVAQHYDLLTALNPGYRKHLRWSAERMGLRPRARILDLCCGTGLSTRALTETYPEAVILGLDGSHAMISQARRKDFPTRVTFQVGDAMNLRGAELHGPWDGILMAYGIRNMPDIDECLSQILSALAPGGVICFHEYSVTDSFWTHSLWNAVALCVIVPFGRATSPRSDIYRYLRKSVVRFDGVKGFEKRLLGHGFVDVQTKTMDGWQRGIVHSFVARRPT